MGRDETPASGGGLGASVLRGHAGSRESSRAVGTARRTARSVEALAVHPVARDGRASRSTLRASRTIALSPQMNALASGDAARSSGRWDCRISWSDLPTRGQGGTAWARSGSGDRARRGPRTRRRRGGLRDGGRRRAASPGAHRPRSPATGSSPSAARRQCPCRPATAVARASGKGEEAHRLGGLHLVSDGHRVEQGLAGPCWTRVTARSKVWSARGAEAMEYERAMTTSDEASGNFNETH